MAVIRINASPSGLSLHHSPQPVPARLREAATQPGLVVILVHGYKYFPGKPEVCPHNKIFGDHSNGWPSQLGFVDNSVNNGLCIALGWQARGTLKSMYHRAQRLGKSLAALIVLLRKQNPARPIHLVAHSLGSEACLCALPHLFAGDVARVVLMTGASYASRAARLLDTPAGRSTEVLNVTSRENDLFDAMFEHLVPADIPNDRTLGQGLAAANAVTLQLDCDRTLARLRNLGFDIAPSQRRICHWSSYTRPGVMQFYDSFLRGPETLTLRTIASAASGDCAPRWSRLTPVLPAFSGRRGMVLRPGSDSLGSAPQP